MRFAIPVASAATAILLASACSDDGPTTLARGEDIDPVGHDNLGGQTLSINAVEEDGEVTGEFRLNEVVITLQCADTDTDGLVILGGEITTPDSDAPEEVGNLLALIIREGDPDSVALFPDVNDAGSCTELLEAIPEDGPDADLGFVELNPGEDIETG